MKTSTYQGKRIAVLGAGESGEAAARLFNDLGAQVTVLDSASAEKLASKIEALKAVGVRMLAGPEAERDNTPYDLSILSPGIDPSVPLVRHFVERKVDIIGELEAAFDLCSCPIVGITGTNGKTTTTQLVGAMLQGAGVRTATAGNIGPAFSAVVQQSGELDVMTLEISSFQLEEIRRFHVNVAIWLNFAPDHLDRYPSMAEYYAAKLRIFENQSENDWAIVNARDTLPELKARKISFSAYTSGADFEFHNGIILYKGEPVLALASTHLRGAHNAENLMAAMGVGIALGLHFDRMIPALSSYKPLPHRCELIRVVGGVEWVNDSKGTNLDSVEKALMSESKPVVLIAGGKDKGFEFDSITDLVAQKCRAAVLMGEMADRIEGLWKDRVRCVNVGRSLEKAVAAAREESRAGDVVLFSPGTSSFDMFKNYADRGNQFRALVHNLPESATP